MFYVHYLNRSLEKNETKKLSDKMISPMKDNPDSGIQEAIARGIWNPGNICLLYPASYFLESRIHV